MYNKTKETVVKGDIQVWAIPRTAWEMEQSEEKEPAPFKFTLRTSAPYQDGAVKLNTQEIMVILPGGIDLLTAALSTLKEQMEVERKTCDSRIAELQKQVDALALIEYIPEAS